jgi:dimethyladenosine transferase 1
LKVAAGPAFSSIVFADMTKLNQHRQLLDILLSLNQSDDEKELHVLGNLPFNVSTVLLTGWLRDLHEQRGLFHDYQRLFKRVRLTFMFQKEVAERILARKESAHRSRLSVVTQAVCSVHRLYDVPSTVFVPRPKVDATVVQFEPLSVPLFKGFVRFHIIIILNIGISKQ